MQEWITHFMTHYGYFAIFFLLALENSFPILPSEIALGFAGFLVKKTGLTYFGVVGAATLGSVSGALILYHIGKIIKKEKIENAMDSKVGRLLGLKKQDVDKSIDWFHKHGNLSVLFARFLPVVRVFISLPAGISKMPLHTFVFFSAIGTALWNGLIIFLGMQAGKNWPLIMGYFEQFSKYFVFLLLFVIVAIGFFLHYRKPKNNN